MLDIQLLTALRKRPRTDPQNRDAYQELRYVYENMNPRNHSWFLQMENIGFRREQLLGKNVLVDRTRGVLIKVMYVVNTKKPHKRVPTLVLERFSRTLFLVLQPIIDTSEEARRVARNTIVDIDGKSPQQKKDYGIDTHVGNIGLWRGQPAVFDW